MQVLRAEGKPFVYRMAGDGALALRWGGGAVQDRHMWLVMKPMCVFLVSAFFLFVQSLLHISDLIFC